MTIDLHCPYCQGKAHMVYGKKVYPHRSDLWGKMFWYCDDGHAPAFVGCHPGTSNPLGRLADANLRRAKSAAHRAFDPIWRGKFMSRNKAYSWLANALEISGKDCHIGMFDVVMCRKVERLAMIKFKELRDEKALRAMGANR